MKNIASGIIATQGIIMYTAECLEKRAIKINQDYKNKTTYFIFKDKSAVGMQANEDLFLALNQE